MNSSRVPPRTELLILQPTSFCNIDCSYCYLPARTDKGRMTPEVLDAAFAKILPSRLVGNHITVVWHAGEPLTVPPDWYQAAFAAARVHALEGCRVEHTFQSNGLLINPQWVEFFRRNGAKICLSIDGPEWLHDQRRRTRNGQGTHARACRGFRLLQEAGIHPPIITVLTAESLSYPDAMFDFYAEQGMHDVAFNVEELEGAHRSSSMAEDGAEEAYRAFMRRFFRRMQSEPNGLMLREWRDAANALRFGVPDGLNQESEPLRIISIARDGAVSTFSPELLGFVDERYNNFLFGNILTDSMETIVERVLSSRLYREIRSGIANCRRTCGWFNWCGGGSPSNKIFEMDDPAATETTYCRLTRQALLDVALSVLERDQAVGLRVA